MENQLTTDLSQIVVQQGVVTFNDYERLRNEALELAQQIEQVEVTDENIQVSKKMLAAVNKRVKEMEDKRILIKKEMMKPYNHFESQVKEIVNIVKTADNLVRNQVRELEEKERIEKRSKIAEIFEKRMKHYSFGEMFGFDDFIKPQHLNKSVSLKSVESEMVEWLEKKDADLKVIKTLPNADYVLTEYIDTKDLTVAIQIVNQREERKKQVEQVVKPVKQSVETVFIISLSDEKDFKLVELFMQQNNIKFNVEKVAK